jgi:Na+-transporting NADH:ubiquinone oxidoreductase subunit A
MPLTVKLKKGFDIRLEGQALKKIVSGMQPVYYGIKPDDFPGLVPKLVVKPGDSVLAGTPLFHDKKRPEILYTSPVSGTVSGINRGDRRKLLEVIVKKKGDEFVDFGRTDPGDMGRDKIIAKLLESGLWPAIRQRPYHIVANPSDVPKSVFISGFDTSPLAPDYNFIMANSPANYFRTGITALKKLTEGRINLILDGNAEPADLLKSAGDVQVHYFSGPHPAGNVGVHIHHIDPLNKGEIVWFVNLQDIIAIGSLFEEGIYKHERIVAFTGSEALDPRYYRIRSGASVRAMAENNVKPGNLRYISGNVLTGSKIDPAGYLGYYDSQVTVIPEGDHYEFFGWLKPGIEKFSFSKTFLSSVFRRKTYRLDTNLHGGERAFVMTGLYEKVVPMDIYPMQLLKAILSGDIDLMENLGIYEIAEEDFALCEFICPSKIEIQSIVRKGLDLMIKEMN